MKTIFSYLLAVMMNLLLSPASFGKTFISDYNSVREGTAGYGRSMPVEDVQADVELDYKNLRQGAVANCLRIVSIKEITKGKIVESSIAAFINPINNNEPENINLL